MYTLCKYSINIWCCILRSDAVSEQIVKMRGISKDFSGVKALKEVDFNIYQGKIMALLGENGAGKSTLMKILTGVYEKTSGEVYFNGEKVHIKNTKEAQRMGITIIHQELNLLPNLSIGENIFLGREPVNSLGLIEWNRLFGDAKTIMDRLGIVEKPETLVGELSIGKQQMVEIAKALSLNAQVIVMDEPTGALTDKETESLFKVIKELRAEGRSIVYISHRLKEIFEICDDVTIMRDGQFIAEYPVKEMNEDMMIELMVGRKLNEQYPYITSEVGDIQLQVKNLNNPYIHNISFNLRGGEIVGLAGLMGSGRTELARTIYGVLDIESGEVEVQGKKVQIKNPGQAIKHGVAYVSEDRKKNGVVLGLNIKENISLSILQKLSGIFGSILRNKEEEVAIKSIEAMSIKASGINQLVKNLSGGNQQKVSLSKSLMTSPKVLILDEPTRGVDVGAKREIYDIINKFKQSGIGILMISSEIPEILGMSDRVLVMHEGRITGCLEREKANQESIMRLAVGNTEVIL
ncbi:ATP-binding cassette domain-containing protein [Serpentinicella alkaliphila]|nr:ATP-binding cassette domain-containing protein [Serpentinicella alkaliphila]